MFFSHLQGTVNEEEPVSITEPGNTQCNVQITILLGDVAQCMYVQLESLVELKYPSSLPVPQSWDSPFVNLIIAGPDSDVAATAAEVETPLVGHTSEVSVDERGIEATSVSCFLVISCDRVQNLTPAIF